MIGLSKHSTTSTVLELEQRCIADKKYGNTWDTRVTQSNYR